MADTEKVCPLCSTRVYHPELEQAAAQPLYPAGKLPESRPASKAFAVSMTVVFSLALLFTALCDLQLHKGLTWSPYVVGGLVVAYVSVILPGAISGWRSTRALHAACGASRVSAR